MSESQERQDETDYEALAEEYQELADAVDEIIDLLDFIAEHQHSSEAQAERAKHMKMAVRDVQKRESWSHRAHNLRQAAHYNDSNNR